MANRKEPPKEEISSLRLILRLSKIDGSLPRASWLSRLLSSFLAKEQVSRETGRMATMDGHR